jgi:hypothetical protein
MHFTSLFLSISNSLINLEYLHNSLSFDLERELDRNFFMLVGFNIFSVLTLLYFLEESFDVDESYLYILVFLLDFFILDCLFTINISLSV